LGKIKDLVQINNILSQNVAEKKYKLEQFQEEISNKNQMNETNDKSKEIFKESSRSIGETKNIKTEKFVIDIDERGEEKIEYLVIDTAGFGDTELDNKEILSLLKDLVPIIKKNGLNQILFVTGGRFTQEEINTYKLLESVIFDSNVVNYTTIIRTRFPEFEDSSACEEDKRELKEENLEIFKILKNRKIIYVDNPRIIGRDAETNKEIREESRTRLLTYLGTCQDTYYSSNLGTLSQRINNYITAEEELKKEIVLKEQKNSEEEIKLQEKIEEVREQKKCELKMTERNFEKQKQWLAEEVQKKIQTTQQEFEEAQQNQLKRLRESHNEALEEVNRAIQNNLNQIRESCNRVQVGEPVCSRGHDRNIQTYDKSGRLIPDYQSDFIGHIYCPTCGENQHDVALRNAQTYTLEEWSKKTLNKLLKKEEKCKRRLMNKTAKNEK